MILDSLLPLADSWAGPAQSLQHLRTVGAVSLDDCPVASRGWILARLHADLGRPLLVVVGNEEAADRLAADLEPYLPSRTLRHLPSALSLLLDDADSQRNVRPAGQRLALFGDWADGLRPAVVIAPATAIMTPAPPPAKIVSRRIDLRPGESLALDTLCQRLTAFGYQRTDMVRSAGDFSRRGDILDVHPANLDHAVRIDLFGDDIETIRVLDVESQRSGDRLDFLRIVPAHEIGYTRETMASAAAEVRSLLEREMARWKSEGADADRLERLRDHAESEAVKISQAAFFPGIERHRPLLQPDAVPVASLVPEEYVLVLDEPAQIDGVSSRDAESIRTNLDGQAQRTEILPVPADLILDLPDQVRILSQNRPHIRLNLMPRTVDWLGPVPSIEVGGAPAESFYGKPEPFADAVRTWVGNGQRVVVVSVVAVSLNGFLKAKDINESPLAALTSKAGLALVDGSLRAGFRIPSAKLVVLTDAEVFGNSDARRRKPVRREFRDGMRITSLVDIKPGDYVVHIHHGVGQYHGLTRIDFQGVEREFLLVKYEGTDKLYVPVDQIDRIQKYIGSEGAPPSLNRLGGTEWIKATAKAKRQAKEIADDLIQLYATRQASDGHVYDTDTPWVRDMEDAFPYVETPDQLTAISDIRADLEKPRPMDRLVCGDVGFGKTEVAMRAAFMVASQGRQVAVLCPTTVLASQHFQTFSERLSAFPVCIDMLSRFRSPKEQARTLDAIRSGAADIVVGTHRLLSKDIEFKDLGLVIVDEEQRFGVVHKERLKQIRQTVDVLTLTATPIPRTLHMALAGIRDMSLIHDPPEGRLPVKTYIKEADDLLVRDAILQEVQRGGQVFFLHNRVESIYHVAHRLERQVVPGVRVRVAHGQMAEDELEEAMLDFYHRKFDVLVCTTIVESGLDIPNVNTIIVDHADKMGLAQLYQLRGRVGRSRKQAYAYLLYPRAKALSTIAEQRLDALREFTDLGSGYKVALRDLELRGAGNLLGAAQSGMVAAVGFDLYCQLLEDAIRDAQGVPQDPKEKPLPSVDIPVAAAIPPKYIANEPQRIQMYKKLSAARDRADVARLQEEFEDRFGDPPAPVWNALALLRLRMRCAEVGIQSVSTEGRTVNIQLAPPNVIPRHALRKFAIAFRAQGHVFEANKVSLQIGTAKVLPLVEEMVERIDAAIKEIDAD